MVLHTAVVLLIASSLLQCSFAEHTRPGFCNGLDCPDYTVVQKYEQGVELRRYAPSTWVETDVQDISYDKASVGGFQRLVRYMLGKNDQRKHIQMTSPLTTMLRLDKQGDVTDDYTVSLFLPHTYQPKPSQQVDTAGIFKADDSTTDSAEGNQNDSTAVDRHGRHHRRRRHADRDDDPPMPEDNRVSVVDYGETDVYVLSFGSYAVGLRVRRLARDFFDFLDRNNLHDFQRSTYMVAVYDPLYKPFDRHNEIWVLRNKKRQQQQQ